MSEVFSTILQVCTFYTCLSAFTISGIGDFYKIDKKFEEVFQQIKAYSSENTVEETLTDPIKVSYNVPKEKEAPKENILTGGNVDILYYNQGDSRWSEKNYGGNNKIGKYGCGPTVLAMVVSSFSDTEINPEMMCKWSFENGYFSEGSGSYHELIPEGAESFGLKSKRLGLSNKEELTQELKKGNAVVAIMAEGHFTDTGHFIILRGITENGEVLIADPKSSDNSLISWDINIILKEAKRGASGGGPFWSIGLN